MDVRDQIVAFKRRLAPNRDALRRAYADVKDHVSRAADRIVTETAAGRPVVPEIEYQDIRNGKVPEDARRSIRSSGCAVVRGVFPAPLASDWFAEVGEYLEDQPLRGAGGREAEPRQVFLRAEGRQAADLQRLLVEAAGDGAAGREARRDARVPRSAVAIRRRLRSRPAVHLCRPRPAPPARRQDARPLAAHGCRHGRALDRSRLSARLRARLRRRLARLRSLRRDAPAGDAARFRRRPCAACSAPIRAGRR